MITDYVRSMREGNVFTILSVRAQEVGVVGGHLPSPPQVRGGQGTCPHTLPRSDV